MAAKILQFPIAVNDECVVRMPKGAKILCMQVQGSAGPCVWAKVDLGADKVNRLFRTYVTGNEHPTITGKYVGMYQPTGGGSAYHVFDEGEVLRTR